jgi:DNA-binding beta-propeller fold protein YncE
LRLWAVLFLLWALPRASSAQEIFIAHDQILVLDAAKRTQIARIPLDEVVNGIAFSKGGDRVFVGSSGGKDLSKSRGGLYLIDAASHRVIEKLSGDPVKEVRVSADGKRVHYLDWKVHQEERAGRKKRPVKEPFRLRTFDISGERPRPLGSALAGMDLYDLAVSPDGKTAYLLDPGHNELRLLDPGAGTFLEIVRLEGGKPAEGTGYQAALAKMALAPEGTRAAVLQSGPARTGILLLDLDARSRRQLLVPGGSNLRAAAFLPGGKRLLGLSLERLLVLDLVEGKLEKTVPLKETFTSLALSASGSEVYLGAPVALKTKEARGGGMLEVLSGQTFELLAQVPVPITVKLLAVSPVLAPLER